MINNIRKLPFNDTLKDKLTKLVTMLEPEPFVEKIILFGSYARMEQRATSDIDILAVVTEIPSREVRGGLRSDFDELNADLLFYTEDKIRNSDRHLAREIRRDGILLWKR